MSNLNVQIKDKSGNVVYPKTLGSLVFNSSNQSLGGVEANAEVNIIESVKVNGSALTPDANRAVDVSVPTYSVVQQPTPDSGYVATYYLSDGTSQQGSKIQIPTGGGGGTSGIIESYIVSGATALDSGWLSTTSGGSALTPTTGVLYVILSSGDYANKLYRWDGTSSYVEVSAIVIPTATSSVAGAMKLYNDATGNNTDGTMTQSAIKSYIASCIAELFTETSDTITINVDTVSGASGNDSISE